MRAPALMAVVMVAIFGAGYAQIRPEPDATLKPQQEPEQRERVRQSDKQETSPLSCEDRNSLAFFDNISQIPIKFLNRRKDTEVLVGQFASPTVLSYKQLEFNLSPEKKNEKNLFFMVDGEWEEEVGRKIFLKKFKNDFWLTSYITVGQENVICEAHQFKNWESLRVSYAQGSKSYSVDTTEFWQNVRTKLVYFYKLDEMNKISGGVVDDGAYWLFVVPTGGIRSESDNIPVKLEDGRLVNKISMFADGTEVRMVDNGIFLFDDKTIFHTTEIKISKLPRVRLANMEFGMLKVRSKPVEKKYFVDNLLNGSWLCFYDKENHKLLRVVEVISLEGRNGNGGNNKNGKNKK